MPDGVNFDMFERIEVVNRVTSWPLSLNIKVCGRRRCLYSTHCRRSSKYADMEMKTGVYMSAMAAGEDDVYPPLFVDQVKGYW